MKAPHTHLVDWVMAPYDGPFPKTERAWENFKCVVLCYVCVPVTVLAIVLAVVSG